MSEVNGIFVVAHELKSPLSLMRQLALSIDLDDKESIVFAKDKMVSTAERAMRQVNDLTKIARLEDGLFELEPVSVRGVCDDVTRELRYLYRKNHKVLQERYTNRSKLAVANREMLYSVIYNFCSNALKYSDNETHSELIVKDSGDKIEIRVRDFGPTLPTAIWKSLKHGWITEPTSVAMRPGSSGLGLYIASKFARFMTGEVSAIRHRDGTSFILKLPVSKQASLFS